MRHIDPVARCTPICTTIHELETTSDRWILDEFWVSARVLSVQTYIITLLVMRAWFWWLIQEVMLLDTSKPWLLISRWRIWVWCTTSWDKKYDRGLMRFSWVKENIKWILKKFSMIEYKSMSTPMVMDLTKNKWWWFRQDWSTCVPTTDWIIDVSG